MVRLWSVALPALCLGSVLDHFGRSIHPQTYSSIFSTDHLSLKYLISSLFLHETWFFSIRPGSNGPFWSLSYEFFYYIIFGAITLIHSLKIKITLGLFSCLIAGPKVLILLPCWLVGCGTHWVCKNFRIKSLLSVPLLSISGFFLISNFIERWTSWTPVSHPGLGSPPLFYSAKYYDDYLIAISIGIVLISLSCWFPLSKRPGGLFSDLIKKCSRCSFSLYAVHFPMMAFLSALWASGTLKIVSHLQAIFIVLMISAAFAMLFEFPLKVYRKSILNIFPYLSQKCGIQP
jgi:peptidoglycan/LPS O-acetylase OafA/YrhL